MGWVFEGPFHQSHLRDAGLCMKMFELKHRYGVPPEMRSVGQVNGTTLHRAIERIHAEDLFDLRDKMVGLYLECFFETEAEELTPIRWKKGRETELDKLATEGGEILANYAARAHNRQCEVLLSEAPFAVEIAGYQFEGTIDQVRRQHGGIVLIDFKSGVQPPIPEVLHMGLQFSIYAYALVFGKFKKSTTAEPEMLADDIIGNGFPDQIVHYQLHDHLPYKRNGKHGKVGDERGPGWYATQRDEWAIKVSIYEIKRICGQIRRGSFPRSPWPQICNTCAVRDACYEDYKAGGLDDKLVRKLSIVLAEEGEE